ncbi:AAA family ATPase [Streptomyces sp. TR02-1]|uniref:AAA family ATPase n=1 Tax=Streptomyces sp. TR02-1 TaxID=3385977 RepID=UPI0039A075A9
MSTTSRDEVIAGEQRAVDHAYDCYAARLAELTGGGVASASATGKDGVANRLEARVRAAEYDGLGNESLVIGRVDVQDRPSDVPETFYVGRRAVSDVTTRDTVVVLWTSSLAKQWFEATPEAPRDVALRRQLRCTQSTVEDYHDEIAPVVLAESSAPTVPEPRSAAEGEAAEEEAPPEGRAGERAEPRAPAGAKRRPPPTPGDVARAQRRKPVQPDDFLLRELERSRRGPMRDIVETIRRDQMRLVTESPSDVLVVQGGPGTGKSAVGLHRVTWLVNNEHFPAQDILVIGPHQRFLDHVGQVLPTLGTRDVNAVQLNRLWTADITGNDAPSARLVKSDERMAAVLRKRVESDLRSDVLDELTTAPSFEGDEPAVVVTAGSATLRLPRSEVLDLLNEAHGGDGPYRQRRERFRNLLIDRLLRELAALAPRRVQDGAIRRDLERNRRVERLIDRIWPTPGAREALRSLYDQPDLLRRCADGVLSDEEQRALHRPRAATADADPWTLEDHVCLEELRFLITGESPRRYGHIVVDEAQDLTPMQARALRRRCAVNGSMTVLGDLAQATGPHTHTSWERLGALLSDHGDWRVSELNTSYRVPAEIMSFVSPLARAVAPALPSPHAVRAAGEGAVRTLATEPWKLLDDTVTEVTRLVGTDDGTTLRSVAVVVPDDSGWLDEIRHHLDAHTAIADARRESVFVLAAAQAKGMEYDHVLVVEPATIADRGPAGLRQLYIALTRSTQSLTVLHTSPLPEALTRSDERTEASPSEPEPKATGGDVPEIGTDIRVRVVAHTAGGNYRVEAVRPATDRTLLLAVRHGSTPPAVGAELDGWVLRHASDVSFVTLEERGRMPISSRMARRYLAAVGIVDELSDGEVPSDSRTRLSELKGMADRCLRLDQQDWLDVWRVLGSPERDRLSLLRDLAADTQRAVSAGALDGGRFRAELERSGWADALATARRTLRQRLAAEPSPPAGTGDSAPAHPPAVKESDRMPDTAAEHDTPEARTGSSPLERALEAAAAADRRCNTHELVRLELRAALLRSDLRTTESAIVDVHRMGEAGHVVYEVLGAGGRAYPDLRSGAVRLLEINHTLTTPVEELFLVLPEAPEEEWAADTVHAVFGVHVLWQTPNGWDGRHVEAALGSAQRSFRR